MDIKKFDASKRFGDWIVDRTDQFLKEYNVELSETMHDNIKNVNWEKRYRCFRCGRDYQHRLGKYDKWNSICFHCISELKH